MVVGDDAGGPDWRMEIAVPAARSAGMRSQKYRNLKGSARSAESAIFKCNFRADCPCGWAKPLLCTHRPNCTGHLQALLARPVNNSPTANVALYDEAIFRCAKRD